MHEPKIDVAPFRGHGCTHERFLAACALIAMDREMVAEEGTVVQVGHAPPLESIACVRQRIYGHRLNGAALTSIVGDVVAGRYADVHLAAFLTATATLPFDEDETYHLTRAMVEAGDRLCAWR